MKKGLTLDNQNKNPEEQKLLDQLQKDYDLTVTRNEQKMALTHTAKEYTFNLTEKRRLLQQQTIKIMVDNAIDDILNMSVLPRVGITPNPKIRVLYDFTLGRFTVFSPKDQADGGTTEESATSGS